MVNKDLPANKGQLVFKVISDQLEVKDLQDLLETKDLKAQPVKQVIPDRPVLREIQL
jgi:hypothetical protein